MGALRSRPPKTFTFNGAQAKSKWPEHARSKRRSSAVHVGLCEFVSGSAGKGSEPFVGCACGGSHKRRKLDVTSCRLSVRLSWFRKRQRAFREVLSWSDSVFGRRRKKRWAFCEVILANDKVYISEHEGFL